MNNGWEIKKLGEVCDFVSRGISPKYTSSNGLCVLNQKCIRDHKINYALSRLHDNGAKPVETRKLLQIGDVLINSTGTGTLGRVAQVKELSIKVTVDSHVTIVRPIKHLFCDDFFGYALIMIEEEIAKKGEGCGGQTELSKNTLKNDCWLKYPQSISEQNRIVAILDKSCAAIAKATENAEKNLQNARDLFKSYLDSIFTNPSGEWETLMLEKLCNIEIGKTPYRANDAFWDKKKATKNVWLSIADLLNANNTSVFDSKEYISDKGASASKIVKAGTLLLSFKLTLGRLAFAGRDLFTNEAIAALTIRNEKQISKKFLYYFLTFFDWHTATKGDVKIKGKTLNKAKLKAIDVHFPNSLSEQRRIVAKLDALYSETKKLEAIYQRKLSDLDELKKSILNEAFSGRLTKSATATQSEIFTEVQS